MNFYQIGFIIGLLSTITVVIALFLLLQNRNKFKNICIRLSMTDIRMS